jgi:hypothetical protein
MKTPLPAGRVKVISGSHNHVPMRQAAAELPRNETKRNYETTQEL